MAQAHRRVTRRAATVSHGRPTSRHGHHLNRVVICMLLVSFAEERSAAPESAGRGNDPVGAG
jgi:hypothetical protein